MRTSLDVLAALAAPASLAWLVALAAPAAAQLVFVPAQPLATLPTPVATALGDLDGDGDLDVVVSTKEPAVHVLLVEDGAATPAQILDGAGGRRLQLADVDGDALLDLILAQDALSPSGLVVRLGEGDGTFGFAKGTQAGTSPLDFVVADLDGDRVLDIVTVNEGIATLLPPDIEVLHGLGGGAFAVVREQQLPAAPLALALADANEDGELDAAIAFDDGTVRILFGTASGPGFIGSSTLTLHDEDVYSGNGADLLAADLDVDGHADLVSTWSDDVVRIVRGGGNGTFGPPLAVAVGDDPTTLALGDFDDDGAPEIVAANVEGADVTVLRRQGPGAWSTLFVSGPAGPSGPSVGDVDGDGRADVVLAGIASDTVALMPNATYAPGAPFVDVGSNLEGSKGWPVFVADSTLLPDAEYAFDLYNAWPGCTAIFVVGFSALNLPFKGGNYVPNPDISINVIVGRDGRASVFDDRWPPGGSGATLYMQWWSIDPGAETGWSASTAVEATIP